MAKTGQSLLQKFGLLKMAGLVNISLSVMVKLKFIVN